VLFLRRLNHPNVVSGHEVLSKPLADGTREFYIVMEYISFDMRDLWLAQKDFSAHPPWHEGHIKHLTLQLLDAMAYMHQRGLMHRDIKLENILFDSGVLKVADLGSIRDAGRTALKLTTAVVTLWYRPPELLLGNTHYTNAIDIWSIGCVIVEMLAMSALFPGRDVDDMMHRIVACVGKPSGADWQAHFAHLPRAGAMWPVISKLPQSKPLETVLAGKSPACIDLIKKMICYDPTQRISAKKAMSHPYFQEDPKPEPYRPRQ
jgi:serine/threonine protein kinase